jgi:hypothetical protein
MTGLLKRVLRWATAVVLILVGLVLALPGVPGPGFLVVLAGVVVLLPESRWLRQRYARLKRRYPRIFGLLETRRRHRRQARREARRCPPA